MNSNEQIIYGKHSHDRLLLIWLTLCQLNVNIRRYLKIQKNVYMIIYVYCKMNQC